ncbi:MAG: hypothetical protein AAB875_02325 [Patescibacteria group bacterium]
MHAYLIVGKGRTLEEKVQGLAKKLKAKIFEYPLSTIEDVRALNSFTSLSVEGPTALFVRGVDEATHEALNAFLKNLEEPQENLYYILTAPSYHKILPTILSRCQLIRAEKYQQSDSDTKLATDFLKMSVAEKISQVDKIKDREKAIEFLSQLTQALHEILTRKGGDYSSLAKNLRAFELAGERLRANGNVTLQLTNMVLSLV